jgi:phage terminase small subunit
MRYKWQAFLNSYLVHFNATRAAKDAGYSEKTARAIGCKLLTNADIKAAILERMASKDEVIAGLTDISRGNLADLMEVSTMGFTIQLMTKDENGDMVVNPKTKLIKKIKQKVTTYLAKREDDEDREVVETEIELYSAHDAYRDLGKVHGIFIDKTEVSGAEGGPVRLEVVYANPPKVETDA